jgi:hypothetical protein
LNRERLTRLCRFLAEHRDTFEAVTFSGGAAQWLAASATINPRFSVSLPAGIFGMVENKVNDYLPWY